MTHPKSQAELTAGEERGVNYIIAAVECFAEQWAAGKNRFGAQVEACNTLARIRRMLVADAIAGRAALPPVAAVPVTRLDVMSLIRAQMHRCYASALDREDVDTRYMQEIEDAIRVIAAAPQPPEV